MGRVGTISHDNVSLLRQGSHFELAPWTRKSQEIIMKCSALCLRKAGNAHSNGPIHRTIVLYENVTKGDDSHIDNALAVRVCTCSAAKQRLVELFIATAGAH